MKRLLRLELGRAFSGHGFFLSLALGLVLSLLHFFLTVLPLSLTIDEYLVLNKEPLAFPGWLYSSWLGADPNSVFAFLYFLILPILASLPFADSFSKMRRGALFKTSAFGKQEILFPRKISGSVSIRRHLHNPSPIS